jgi:tetratricopeptide (TPR) repeat protein
MSGPGKELLEVGSGDRGSVQNGLDEAAKLELQRSELYYQKIIGTAHNNVGLLRAERQDFAAAAEQFTLAAKWDPQQEGLDYNLGLAYYKSQSYKQATSPLENELKLHPDNRAAATLLGITLFRLGNYARASELLSAAVETQGAQSTDADIYYALASSLIRQRKTAAADEVIAQMRTTLGDVPQLHLLLAEQHEGGGVRAQALAELSEVAAASSNSLLVHYNAGLLYLKLDKRDEAVAEFERALVLNPNDIEAKTQLDIAKQLRSRSQSNKNEE